MHQLVIFSHQVIILCLILILCSKFDVFELADVPNDGRISFLESWAIPDSLCPVGNSWLLSWDSWDSETSILFNNLPSTSFSKIQWHLMDFLLCMYEPMLQGFQRAFEGVVLWLLHKWFCLFLFSLFFLKSFWGLVMDPKRWMNEEWIRKAPSCSS